MSEDLEATGDVPLTSQGLNRHMDHSAPRSRVCQEHGLCSAEKRTASGHAASGPMLHPSWARSQTTKNRKVEARQSVSFRNPIFGFSLSNSTSRQSPVVCPQRTRTLLAWPIWSGHKSETSLNIRAKTDARIPRRKAERGHECLPVFISTLAWRTCVCRGSCPLPVLVPWEE